MIITTEPNSPNSPPPGEKTDAELVAAAQGGDARATEALLARFEAPVFRFAMSMCRDEEDAREVLQETLLAAAKGLAGFRGDSAVSTWLFTIARSFAIKQKKRRARGGDPAGCEEASELPDPALGPDEAAMGREVSHAIERAMSELSESYREVLVLRDVEGLTAPEVAAALGIRVDAVKSRLHRARVAMREKLAPLLGEMEAPAHGCPDVINMFSRKLEGEVDAHICEEMERHLEGCPRCAAACDGLRRSLSLCVALRDAPVPPRVQQSVRRAVRELLRVEGE